MVSTRTPSSKLAFFESVLEAGGRVMGINVAGGAELSRKQITALEDFVKDYDGVKVAVDRQSAEMLQGAEVDFVDGLQGAGFKISNPNVSRSCGCGNSFS